MTKKTKPNWREVIANFFGVFGYFNVALQWLFLLIFSLPLMKSLNIAPETPTEQPVIIIQQGSMQEPSILSYVFAAIVVVVMIALSLYVLIRIPMSIVKSSHRIVEEGSGAIAPLVARATHAKNPEKVTRNLKPYLSLAIKLLLSITPLILLFALRSQLDFTSLPDSTVYIISFGLTILSFVLFGIQYSVARFGAIRFERLL